MKTYAVRYFDGASSRAHQASLELRADSWLITYQKLLPPPPKEPQDLPAEGEELAAQEVSLPEGRQDLPAEGENAPALADFPPEDERAFPTEPAPAYETIEVVWELSQIHKRDTTSRLNTFHYGEIPYASIECDAPDFPDAVQAQYPQLNLFNKHYFRLFKMGRRGVLLVGLSLVGCLIITYLFILPIIAESAVMLIPRETERQLGDNLYQSFASHYTEEQDLTVLVNEYARHVDFRADYPIRISVVRSPDINAFAVPGGRIVVFTGLLDKMKNHEELAALLGHEVAHVQERHSLKAMARAFAGYFFVSAIFTDINGMTATITENAQFLQTMRHSRQAEAEADAKAAEVMVRSGIHLAGLVDLFKRLEHEHDDTTLDKTLNFVSSHPQTKDRKAFALRQLKEHPQPKPQETLENIWAKIKHLQR